MIPKRAHRVSDPPSSLRRRHATSVLARELLRDVASVLDAEGIRVMPLGGVLFEQLRHADPARRSHSDVDILVSEQDFERARIALVRAGFEPRSAGRSPIECAFRARHGLSVDLHQRLFGKGRYKLSTEALFRRASRDESSIGVPLYIPHPHDTAAHLIGKFVSEQERSEVLPRLLELADWVHHCCIDPVRLGRHLRACGMLRAGHYVLSRGAELLDDPFFRAALAAFPADRLDRVYTRVARALMRELHGTGLASLPAHLLNASLAQEALSLTLGVAQRLQHAWWRRPLPAALALGSSRPH